MITYIKREKLVNLLTEIGFFPEQIEWILSKKEIDVVINGLEIKIIIRNES